MLPFATLGRSYKACLSICFLLLLLAAILTHVQLPANISTIVLTNEKNHEGLKEENEVDDLVNDSSKAEALLDERAKKNLWNGTYLICALANAGHYEFTMNFILSLKRNGYDKFLILCLDTILYRKLLTNGLREHIAVVPRVWMPMKNYSTDEVIFDQPAYVSLTRSKTHIYYEMLMRGYTLFVNDVDLVWLSPHVLTYIEFAIPSHVEFAYTMDDFTVNTGCYLARPTALVKKLFRESVRRHLTSTLNEQLVLNEIFRQHGMETSHLTRGLDPMLFANGKAYRVVKKFGFAPIVLHANWLVGKKAKRQLLANANAWYFNEIGWS